METLVKHFYSIIEVDGSTFTILLLMCCAALWFIRDGLANPAMGIFIFPVILFLSMSFYYLFLVLELFPTNKPEQWLMFAIMAGSIGVSVGIAMVAALARYWDRPTAG
jgi:hypothetical protein